MLYFTPNGFREKNSAELEIRRCKQLLGDLVRLRSGTCPDEKTLSRSPKFDRWFAMTQEVPVLFGPSVDTNCQLSRVPSTTSEVLVIASELGWIRTRDSFVRFDPRCGKYHAGALNGLWVEAADRR